MQYKRFCNMSNCMMLKTRAITKICSCAELTYTSNTWGKTFIMIVIMLRYFEFFTSCHGLMRNFSKTEESVVFYLIWFHSSYYLISLKFRRVFQKQQKSCFRTSKELFDFTLSFAHWVLCQYRIIIILMYLFDIK